jgi:peptidyl-prolyl cis-trans isomerase C
LSDAEGSRGAPARRWLREPALHFVLIGLGLFGLHAAVARRAAPERIVVSASYLEGLRREQIQRNGRPPTPDEERGLVDRFIDDEVLYRQAISLGLDRGDLIVRRRLVQKMEFVLRGASAEKEPSTAELQAFLDAHAERYGGKRAVSFHHVFLSRDRRGEGTHDEAVRALAALRGGADPGAVGDPFLQGASWKGRTEPEVAAIFGEAFAKAVIGLAPGTWSEPVPSSYGEHLVRVDERVEPSAPALTAVLARVHEDWLAAKREDDDRAALRRLRDRYVIDVEAPR